MIASQGAQISLSTSAVIINRSELAAALAGEEKLEIAFSHITGITVVEPTALDSGYVSVQLSSGDPVVIAFAPNQQKPTQEFADAMQKVLAGETPPVTSSSSASQPDSAETDHSSIPGLNFVALDVETANKNFGSICQIGVTRVVDGELAESKTWLCQPPTRFNYFETPNVAIHHITADDVADTPSISEVLSEVMAFIGTDSLLAHNAQFDATALRDAAAATDFALPPVSFGCSLALARAAHLSVKNHKLPTLAAHFEHSLENHHDAGADATAAAAITIGLAKAAKHQGSFEDLIHSQGFTLGVIAEGAGRVTPVLRDRSGAGRRLQAQSLKPVSPAVGGAGTDFRSNDAPGSASQGSSLESKASQPSSKPSSKPRRPAPWDAVATPDTIPDTNKNADPQGPLFGQNVTLTGDFEPFDKGRLWDLIADAGGTVGKNVTKKTTILVAGSWATKTSKEKRAEQLQEQGQDIAIWSADQLLDALGLSEEPPF